MGPNSLKSQFHTLARRENYGATWYRVTVAFNCWILIDSSIQVNPTAECNDGTVPA